MQTTIVQSENRLRISWENGASVCFALAGQEIHGIDEVTSSGIALRNPGSMWRPYFATPEGLHYTQWQLVEATHDDNGEVRIQADVIGYPTHFREDLDEYLGDIFVLRPETGEVRDRFEWHFKPSELEIDGHRFTGFSYSFHFEARDPKRKIYRLFDAATWEIGGTLRGNTLIFQGQLNPPVTELEKDQYFTTACNYYGAEMCGILGPEDRVSIQRLPRFATIQAFDFIAHDSGVLLNYYEPLEEVFSILQSEPGEDTLHIVDEVRRPLASTFTTHPKHVLFHALDTPLTDIPTRNLWNRTYDWAHDKIRARQGIKQPEVFPRVWTPQVKTNTFLVYDKEVKREDALYYLADNVLPLWAEMGVKEICTPSLWVSDYTVDRYTTKEEHSALQGQLTVSGICCVRVHEIDPLWGGVEAVKYFVDRAHHHGMKVQLWWASHLSRRAPIFNERPDFMMTARDGLPNGGGFGHDILITLNLNNPDCFEWEFQKLKAVYEATGVDGFFHDSYGNMTFLPLDSNDESRLGQQEPYERLMARLQELGMNSFSVEGIGSMGTGHFGMRLAETKPGAEGQYQNALDWWIGQEDMLYGLNMGMDQEIWEGREDEARQFAFRAMAGGGRFGFTEMVGNVEMWSGWLKEMNQVHAQVAPLNGRRELLADGNGVLWRRDNGENILFGYRPFAYPAGVKANVEEINAHGPTPAETEDGMLVAKAGRVYRWKN